MTKKWYKWPQDYYKKPWRPWYDIAWKVSTFPLVLVSFALFYLALAISQGPYWAENFRKDWSLF